MGRFPSFFFLVQRGDNMELKIIQITVSPGDEYKIDGVAEVIAVRFIGDITDPYDTTNKLQARLICRMK